MRISWLLDLTPGSELSDLTGLCADALVARGHEVRIIVDEKPSTFFGGRRAEWIELDDFRILDVSGDDAVVASSPRTARIAKDLAGDRAVADLRMPLVVPDEIYRSHTPREHDPLRVLIEGASQDEDAAVDDRYGAVAHARWFHQKLDLIRVAPWAPSRQEPLEAVQEFHVALSDEEMTRLLHSCDVVLANAETFIAAAAMAAGVACLSEPARSAVDLGEKLIEVLSDDEVRERLRVAGREAAEQWRMGVVGGSLEGMIFHHRGTESTEGDGDS